MPSQAEIEAVRAYIRTQEKLLTTSVISGILEAAERARWQPIETAPKDEPILLGWSGMRTFAVVAHWIRGNWRLDDSDEFGIAGRPPPKWYQPLPSPPETK